MIPLPTERPPVSCADIPPEWIALVGDVVRRDGYALREGTALTIEVKSLTTNEWLTLMLPGNGRLFATAQDRGAVLAGILGRACK